MASIIVAVDTCDRWLNLALKTPDGIQCVQEEEAKSAQKALSALSVLCQRAGCSIRDIERFAVTTGPGRFAGMRSGIALVQGLAFGGGAKIIPIPSLHAWAFSAMQQLQTDRVWVCIDARMQQWAHQYFEEDVVGTLPDPQLSDADTLAKWLSTKDCLVVGTGLDALSSVEDQARPEIILQPSDLIDLALLLKAQSPDQIKPCYLRAAVG